MQGSRRLHFGWAHAKARAGCGDIMHIDAYEMRFGKKAP